MNPGLYPDMRPAIYHGSPGVSKSQLDLIAVCPALLLWDRNAPEEPAQALDFGEAFHTLILEPDMFAGRHAVAPVCDRRTTVGKAAWAEFEQESRGLTLLTSEDHHKLESMRGSVMAHPTARKLLEAEGLAEPSIFWIDPTTGELCRMRPDKWLPREKIIIDVKTCGNIDRFDQSAWDFRYHVGRAHYLNGAYEHNDKDDEWSYIFIVVSSALVCGKYPVRVFDLSSDLQAVGQDVWTRDMRTYAECKRTGKWPGIETLNRPKWAK